MNQSEHTTPRGRRALSIAWKISLTATTTTVIAVAVAGWLSFSSSRELLLDAAVQSMEESVSRQVERMTHAIEQVRNDAILVSRSEAVRGIMRARTGGGFDKETNMSEADWRKQLERVFTVMIESKGYQQVRLIGFEDNGLEIVRVDAPAEPGGSVRVRSDDELQTKGNREYVKRGKTLAPGQSYISSISLNREHGVIEQPWKPTQRFVATVFREADAGDAAVSSTLTELAGRIRYLDEVLTMSALAAAQSNSLKWEQRYKKNEPLLEEAINRAISLLPSSADSLHEIESANRILVEMEHRTFQLVREGQQKQAVALIEGETYSELKAHFQHGLEVFLKHIEHPKLPFGIVVINTDASRVMDLLEEGGKFSAILANDQGGILRHPNRDLEWAFEFKHGPGLRETEPSVWQSVIGNGGPIVWVEEQEEVHATGRVSLGGDDRFLAVIMTAREDDVLASVAGLQTKVLTVSLLAIVGTCALCVLAVRRLIRPISVLTAQADQLSSGVKNVRLSVDGDDEVGRLGRAFSKLVEQLQQRTLEATRNADKVRKLNESLESKVDQRTAELAESEAKARAILDSAADAIITIDSDGIIQSFNPAAEHIFGHSQKDIIGRDITLLIPPTMREAHKQGFRRCVETGHAKMLGHTVEVAGLRKDGTEFPLELTINRIDGGERTRFTALGRDITERKQAEEQLRIAATTDKLTGLPNRSLFHSHIQEAIERSKADPKFKFAVLFFDFDRFKIINDSLGHDVGDALLIDIAQQFKSILRHGDIAARFGGDEFVVLLNDLADYSEAHLTADRLLNAFAEPHDLLGHSVTSTASIGLVTNEQGYNRAEEMIRDADAAMYVAKESGKNRVVVFDKVMHEKALDKLRLEIDLRHALSRDELELVYQPIINMASGELAGFEALIRWKHPDRGTVSPIDFIPIAEDTGMIVDIGRWTLRTAANRIADWNRRLRPSRLLSVNVNVSKRQILHPTFRDDVIECRQQNSLQPEVLKLEITESFISDDRCDVVPLLRQIREDGFQIVMDDFGTGVSSLSTLHAYPIDMLKIDQAFIRGLDRDRSLLAVVASITSLAENLGIQTVAEGIETEDIVGALQSIDCTWGQGYYFAKPMSVQDAERYILDHTNLRAA